MIYDSILILLICEIRMTIPNYYFSYIHTGCLNDPKGFPGLAHLCEHTLFSGTKKYPQENEFSHFVTKNGGQYCARTSSDYTNYYCSSKTDAFRPLLDRLINSCLKLKIYKIL